MAEKIQLEVEVKGGESVASASNKVKSLKTQLKEMKSLLASGTLDEGQFKELSEKAGELQDRIGDVNNQVKNLASDSRRLDGFLGIANGIASGFAAAQGAIALFGSESEDLQKTLIKVQAATALLSGVQSLQNDLQKQSAFMMGVTDTKAKLVAASTQLYTWATKNASVATNVFRTSLVALTTAGIGVAIILLAKYAEKLQKQRELEEERAKSLQELTDELKSNQLEANKQINAIEKYNAVLQDSNRSIDEKRTAYKELQKLIPSLTDYTYEQAKSEGVLNEAIKNEIKLIGLRAKATALENFVVKEETKKIEEAEKKRTKADLEKLANQNKLRAAGNEVVKINSALIQQDEKKLTYAEQLAQVNDEILKTTTSQNKIAERGKQLKEQEQIKEIAKPIEKEVKIKVKVDKVDNDKQFAELGTRLANQTKAEIEKSIEDRQTYKDQVLAIDQAIQDSRIGIAEQTGQLLGQVAGKNKEVALLGLALEKGSAIASVIVNTQREISGYYAAAAARSALTAGTTTAFDQALAAKQSIFAKVRAGLSIASITAAGISGAKSINSGSPSSGSGGGGNQSNQPNIQGYTTNNIPNQQRGGSGNMRVYVTETDIRNSSRKVDGIYSQATVE